MALITTGSSNNTATITGSGSVWSTTNGLYVGYVGSSNQLYVLDGGAAYALSSYAGALATSSNNTIVVSGVGSVMSNTFNTYVGDLGPENLLVVSNGGAVFDEEGILSYTTSSGDNTALIDGTGSTWSNSVYVYVGYVGGTNQMKVTSGGAVAGGEGVVGYSNSSPGNVVLISGAGSTWTTVSNLFMGYMSAGNQVIVSNGGSLFGSNTYIGTYPPSSNNTVTVTGSGSTWVNTNVFYLGDEGAGNKLIINNGGLVSGYGVLGNLAGSSNNTALVTGAGSVWNGEVSLIGPGSTVTVSNGGAVLGYYYVGGGSSGSNGLLIVTGSGSTVSNNTPYPSYVGYFSPSNVLEIVAGGKAFDGFANVGYFYATNNLAVVSGTGSVWTVTNTFEIGDGGVGNLLVVTNGGAVYTGTNGCTVGDASILGGVSAASNSALVAGSGSVWSNGGSVYLGNYDYGNALAISNGALLFDAAGAIGYATFGSGAASNNTATVTGSSSVWNNAGSLTIGQGGPSNQLFVTAGGRVIATTASLGQYQNNLLRLSNGVIQAAVSNGIGNFLTGSGTITGNTINFGTISANINGATLTFANGLSNRGFIGNTGTGILEVYGLFFNVGTTGFTNGSAIFHGTVLSAQGTTNTWNVPASGPWEQAVDWSQGVTPSPTNAAILITNTVTKTVTVSSNTFASAPGSVTNFGITVSGPSGSTNTLVISNSPVGSPFTAVTMYIATNGMATITNAAVQIGLLDVGTLNVDGGLQVGPGSVLDASNVGTMNVGYISTGGSMTIAGGTVLSAVTFLDSLGATVVVSGVGSVWSNIDVTDYGTIIITNGGSVVTGGAIIQNTAIVSGTGSVWSANAMEAGYDLASDVRLYITDGATVYSAVGEIDELFGNDDQVTVAGNGATWNLVSALYSNISNEGEMYIGEDGYGGDGLNIGPGGTVLARYIILGQIATGPPDFINMTGGSLILESNRFVNGELDMYDGTLVLSGGVVSVSSLVLETNLATVSFNEGTLNSAYTQATNGVPFVVGDGVDAANFVLQGGVHSFNSLEISNAAVLSGCGTVTGPVRVDSGGTILSDCGTLTFTGIVTNNGTMRAINGSVLETYNNLVNNGTIDIIDGGVTNFHGAFVNHGTVLNAGSVKVLQVSPSGQDFVVQVPSVPGHTYQLQYTTSLTPTNWTDTAAPQPGTGSVLTFTDPGGATNFPARFYRVDCTAP
jgi:T5SS/PEP-CTERM-associated repeat protein